MARLSLRMEGEIKSFSFKKNLEEFITEKPVLENAKGTYLSGKEKTTNRNKKIIRNKKAIESLIKAKIR